MNHFVYYLQPVYTHQKSFYGKAKVFFTQDGGDKYYTLHSYGTPVLYVHVCYDNAAYLQRLWDGYSATTMRHVNELLMQQGFPKLSARAWRSMEVGNFYTADDVPALEKSLK